MFKNRIITSFHGGDEDFQKIITDIIMEKLHLMKNTMLQEERGEQGKLNEECNLPGGEEK